MLYSEGWVPETVQHGWLYRRMVLPLLAMLRMGASPEKLAWSIAIGTVIGINPLLGTTTLLCLGVALLFRLNVAASQLANHVVYPLEWLLVVPFIRVGCRIFGTEPLPLSPRRLLHEARTHPVALTRELWVWQWHALAVWAAVAAVVAPLLALALTPVLRRWLERVERHQYPIVSAV